MTQLLLPQIALLFALPVLLGHRATDLSSLTNSHALAGRLGAFTASSGPLFQLMYSSGEGGLRCRPLQALFVFQVPILGCE